MLDVEIQLAASRSGGRIGLNSRQIGLNSHISEHLNPYGVFNIVLLDLIINVQLSYLFVFVLVHICFILYI